MSKRDQQRGFSFVELSVLIVILAFVATNFFTAKENFQDLKERVGTLETLKVLQQAMDRFVINAGNSRLPCPAEPSVAVTNATFGKESGCSGNGIVSYDHGTTGLSTADEDVVIGTVPVYALGLPRDFTFDKWGNRITYAVAFEATNSSNYVASTDSHIKVVRALSTSNSSVTPTVATASSNAFVTQNAAYVLVSHGPDGAGAYKHSGDNVIDESASSCNDVQAVNDVFNCSSHRDAHFIKPPAGTAGFDDIITVGYKRVVP